MKLFFQCQRQVLKLDIDRVNKKLVVTSQKTHYKPLLTDWKNLFDPGKEELQERITDRLNDDEFKQSIILSMAQIGYKIKKIVVG